MSCSRNAECIAGGGGSRNTESHGRLDLSHQHVETEAALSGHWKSKVQDLTCHIPVSRKPVVVAKSVIAPPSLFYGSHLCRVIKTIYMIGSREAVGELGLYFQVTLIQLFEIAGHHICWKIYIYSLEFLWVGLITSLLWLKKIVKARIYNWFPSSGVGTRIILCDPWKKSLPLQNLATLGCFLMLRRALSADCWTRSHSTGGQIKIRNEHMAQIVFNLIICRTNIKR